MEPTLRTDNELSGRLVYGHVDGVAQVLSLSADASSSKNNYMIGVPSAARA